MPTQFLKHDLISKFICQEGTVYAIVRHFWSCGTCDPRHICFRTDFECLKNSCGFNRSRMSPCGTFFQICHLSRKWGERRVKNRKRGEIIYFKKILFRYSLLRGIHCYGMWLKGEKKDCLSRISFVPFCLRNGKADGEWRDDFKVCRFSFLNIKLLGS